MRDHDGELSFMPRLPARIERLAFRLLFRGSLLKVTVAKTEATYTIVEGQPLGLSHHGETITVMPGQHVSRAIPPVPAREAPRQPPGRAPDQRAPNQ
jgi:alpha,alpha-trehalose phosphorylase